MTAMQLSYLMLAAGLVLVAAALIGMAYRARQERTPQRPGQPSVVNPMLRPSKPDNIDKAEGTGKSSASSE